MAGVAPSDPPPILLAGLARVELRDPLLISDLHLNAAAPATLARFLRFCAEDAAAHAELAILGDLFEYWIGDDTLDDESDAVARDVAAALRALADRGVRVYVMHGNRDLLLGAGFLRATGAQLLADPALASINGREALLAHGDAWCTQDVEYMRFRATVRQEATQRQFLAGPRAARLAFMGAARAQSETGKRAKAMEIMDVTPAAVDEALRASRQRLLIHGHTHRPAVHRFTIDGEPAERWVLTDWDFDVDAPGAARGAYVAADEAGALYAVALAP
jgi:UDP-2,3-diacylglucosamine hydrolase